MTFNPRHVADVDKPPGEAVAFVHGFPLNMDEALAFQAFQAGVQHEQHVQILAAWRTKLVLIHGYGVVEKLAFINLEDTLKLK